MTLKYQRASVNEDYVKRMEKRERGGEKEYVKRVEREREREKRESERERVKNNTRKIKFHFISVI